MCMWSIARHVKPSCTAWPWKHQVWFSWVVMCSTPSVYYCLSGVVLPITFCILILFVHKVIMCMDGLQTSFWPADRCAWGGKIYEVSKFCLYKEIRLQECAESGLKFTRLVWSQEFLFCTFALTPIGQHPNPSDIHHYSHVFRSLSLLTQLADHRFFFEQMWLGSFVVFFRLFNTIVQVRMIPALRSCIS
jgi:hypothetical protein